ALLHQRRGLEIRPGLEAGGLQARSTCLRQNLEKAGEPSVGQGVVKPGGSKFCVVRPAVYGGERGGSGPFVPFPFPNQPDHAAIGRRLPVIDASNRQPRSARYREEERGSWHTQRQRLPSLRP